MPILNEYNRSKVSNSVIKVFFIVLAAIVVVLFLMLVAIIFKTESEQVSLLTPSLVLLLIACLLTTRRLFSYRRYNIASGIFIFMFLLVFLFSFGWCRRVSYCKEQAIPGVGIVTTFYAEYLK